MTLEIIIDAFKKSNPEIGDISRLKNECEFLPEIEETFISKLSDDLKNEYKNLKYDFYQHIEDLNYADYTKILAFGIKIGLELKEQFDNILDF